MKQRRAAQIQANQCEEIVGNMSSLVRRESLDGRSYYVSPVVMIVEGVHNGSSGPVYYSSEELAKFPEVWNGKPVVIYHPDLEGKPVSACSPAIFEKQTVGTLFNTAFSGGKLKSEIWMDIEKTMKIDPRVIHMLEDGAILEVSTGLFTEEDEEANGVWNGEKYSRVAYGIRPDHLAILPDQVGACSVQDGAGTPRINAERFNDLKFGLRLFELRSSVVSVVANELSNSELAEKLFDKLVSAHTVEDKYQIWIEDVYADKVIYGVDGKGPLIMRGFTVEDENVILDLGFKYVDRKVSYFPVANEEELNMGTEKKEAPVASEAVVHKEKSPEKILTLEEFLETAPESFRADLREGLQLHRERKSDLVDALVKNEHCDFTVEELQGKPVTELQKLFNLSAGAAVEEKVSEETEPTEKEEDGEEKTQETPKINFAAKGPVASHKVEQEPLMVPVFNFETRE